MKGMKVLGKFRRTCKDKYVDLGKGSGLVSVLLPIYVNKYARYKNNKLDKIIYTDIIILTLHDRGSPMAKLPRAEPKQQSLRTHGVLHRHPEAVTDQLFQQLDFFDPRDLLQVKYEMLRRVEVDGYSVSAVAPAFGLSRPSFYDARSAWQQEGLAGLLPKKRGPHGGHKLTAEIVMFLRSKYSNDGSLTPPALAAQVAAHFAIEVHPRSIERALQRAEKKHR
jgi:transposase